jgi:hypothetical protein
VLKSKLDPGSGNQEIDDLTSTCLKLQGDGPTAPRHLAFSPQIIQIAPHA